MDDDKAIMPFPSFPTDIGRLILERLALQNRKDALNLVRVSNQVKQWIEPLIYRSVVIRCHSRLAQFIRTLEQSTKSESFFASHVKFLVLLYDAQPDLTSLTTILAKCSGIISLAYLYNGERSKSTSLDVYSLLSSNLLRLGIRADSILCTPAALVRLNKLTHLNIKFWDQEAVVHWEYWDTVCQLETLTHLHVQTLRNEENTLFAFDPEGHKNVVRALSAFLPAACQLCIVESNFGWRATYPSRVINAMCRVLDYMDPRFVIMVRHRGWVNEQRYIYYDVHKRCRPFVQYISYTSIPEWDGSGSAMEYWDLGMIVMKEAAGEPKPEDCQEVRRLPTLSVRGNGLLGEYSDDSEARDGYEQENWEVP